VTVSLEEGSAAITFDENVTHESQVKTALNGSTYSIV
jgi:copper chaperone CopZ